MRTLRRGWPAIGILVAVASCGGTAPATESGTSHRHTVRVFAASSLTAAFSEIGAAFEHAHPGYSAEFTFGASSELARQIGEGAPADVFAAADTETMAAVIGSGVVTGGDVFATNTMQIIVAHGNPLGVSGIGDLARGDLVVVTCDPTVPCGAYARRVLDSAGVDLVPKSLEHNVGAVVTKVTLGEADAGIVYVTDVIAAGTAASGVEIPPPFNILANYSIGWVSDGDDVDGARAFVAYVMSAAGREMLAGHGFGPPA